MWSVLPLELHEDLLPASTIVYLRQIIQDGPSKIYGTQPLKNWRGMVCLKQDCLPQILLSSFLNRKTLTRSNQLKNLRRSYPAGMHLFEVNNGKTRTICENCSKLTVITMTLFWCLCCQLWQLCLSGIVLVFPLLTLNK